MSVKIRSILPSACILAGALISNSAASAAPAASSPYNLSVFAKSANGYSQPDSIVQWNNSIIVGFENHVAKDGSDGKSSTIVQFSLNGQPQRMFSVKGHNDGLRVIDGDQLWCLQNEDANPNLVVIDLESGHQKTYTFAPTPHGGGYDDMIVQNGQVYITASNPTLSAGMNPNPALVRARLSGDSVILDTILNGNSSAVDIPTGSMVTLTLTDPDSLTVDQRGNIVMDSQADGELIFIRNAGTSQQFVGRLPLSAPGITIDPSIGPFTVDDTNFASSPEAYMLVTDIDGDTIYRIDSPQLEFEPGVAYTASDSYGIVGTLDLDTGVVSPIVTGLMSGRGLIFVQTSNHGEGGGDNGGNDR